MNIVKAIAAAVGWGIGMGLAIAGFILAIRFAIGVEI